jgi:hypothetical protein
MIFNAPNPFIVMSECWHNPLNQHSRSICRCEIFVENRWCAASPFQSQHPSAFVLPNHTQLRGIVTRYEIEYFDVLDMFSTVSIEKFNDKREYHPQKM